MKLAALALASCAPAAVARVPARPPKLLSVWSLDGLHVTGAPALDRSILRDLERFDDAIGYRLLDFDLSHGVLADHGGELDSVRRPGAPPQALTPYDVNVDWAAYLDAGSAVYTADTDGDENMLLWQRDLVPSRGEVKRLHDTHSHVMDPFRDRKGALWWTELASDGRSSITNPFVYSAVGTPGERWSVLDASITGDRLLVRRSISASASVLYALERPGWAATALTPETGSAAPAGAFGAGNAVYAACTCGGDRAQLVEITDRVRPLAPELAWDVTQVAVSPDGSYVAFTTDEDGASVLHIYDVKARAHHVAADGPTRGLITDLRAARDATVFAFTYSDATHPRNVYTYDPLTVDLRRWTDATTSISDLVQPTVETIASFDRTPLHALVYRAAHPTGVVLELHGGPEDHFTRSWSPFEQALVARGYTVVQPNVRGSIGYGAKFAALDDGRHREDAVRDVGAVLDWIDKHPELGARTSVLGTSYGGYLALAALAAYPDHLRAGIVLSGITDFPSFLAHTAAYRADERRAEYGDERDPATRAFLAKISPIAHAAAIRAPILVAHGRRDPRVPVDDSDRFVTALRAAGGTVWYANADDEGHVFTKTSNRSVLQALVIQLLASTDLHR
jgi:prolyl oligopeptidase PreP (S9A serine peptidase family)